jgi:site-specific recombinase XerD
LAHPKEHQKVLTRMDNSGNLAAMTTPEPLTLSVVPANHHALSTPVQRPTQRTLADTWLNVLSHRGIAGEVSRSMLKGYRQNVGAWLDFLDLHGIDDPATSHVMRWLGELQQEQQRKAATIARYLSAVRSFYNWTAQNNLYRNIAREAKGPKVIKDGALECLDKRQVAQLLRMAKGDSLSAKRDCAIVQIIFSTAVRCVSLCEANVGDIDLDTGALVFRNKGSNDKSGRAVLSDSALVALREYLNSRAEFEKCKLSPDAPLIASVGNRSVGQRLDERTINRIVVALMERAGHVRRAEGKIVRPRIFGVHSLRRSAITAVYEQDGVEVAQTLAHHADPKTTTKVYVRANKANALQRSARTLDLGELLEEAI